MFLKLKNKKIQNPMKKKQNGGKNPPIVIPKNHHRVFTLWKKSVAKWGGEKKGA